MANAYTPPGVSVRETITTQVSPLLATPANVCLVGMTRGYMTRTDQFVISGTTPVALPGLPTGSTVTAVASVKDALDPSKGAADGSGYVLTDDYTVTLASGTITRVSNGDLADGTLINVTYSYIPSDYFMPYRLYSIGDVESRYGYGLDQSTGATIASPVSYAAGIAFENGADSVIIQPLLKRATPGNPSTAASLPSGSDIGATSTWADTLYNLRSIDDVNVLVPVIGQSDPNVSDSALLAIFGAFQDHMAYMQNNYQYIVSLFGEDSSANLAVATDSVIKGHASSLQSRYGGAYSECTVLLNTSRFTRSLPTSASGGSITIGGQYVAAGIAGMLCATSVSDSLTRDVISGITGSLDTRDANAKNADAQAGLMVIEQVNGLVRIRHSITLDNSGGAARAELSVVRAKHRMIESVRDTLENQIIGKIIADGNSPFVVRSAVVGVLEALRQSRDLVDYSAVDCRLASLDPTTMQVTFSYRPAFPLNYVNISFSLDLSAAAVSVDSSTNTIPVG